jgi:hypothetical protein
MARHDEAAMTQLKNAAPAFTAAKFPMLCFNKFRCPKFSKYRAMNLQRDIVSPCCDIGISDRA